MHKLVLTLALIAATSGAAFAQSFQDRVIEQLSERGYTEFRISRTLLGRVRIVALNERIRREIVFNPVTGVILRDYWTYIRDDDDRDRGGGLLFDPEEEEEEDDEDNSGHGGGDDHNSGSGKDEEEEIDDDNSGSGSSNSGSGSSNSGSGSDDD